MKRIQQRLLALLLIVVLAGCGVEYDQLQESDEPVIPQGRYVEEQLTLPAELQDIKKMARADDGTLYLFGSVGGNGTGPWGLWTSQDDGTAWSPQEYPWLEELYGEQVLCVGMSEDKTFYIIYREGDGPNSLLAKAETGALEKTNFSVPTDQYGSAIPAGILPSQNRNLILVYAFEVYYTDSVTGEILQTFDPPTTFYMGGEACERGGTLYLSGQAEIVPYHLETGQKTGNVISPPMNGGDEDPYGMSQGYRVTAVSESDEAVYYCDSSGLYRSLPDSPVTELLLNGERSSLGMPTMEPRQLIVLSDDRYLVLGKNGSEGNVLYRYAYDPSVPAEPSINLRVYSLYESPTIRQAAGVFQRESASVKVTHEVGIAGNTGVAPQDALRVLATELVAGNGPDVLVLDDMPVDRYMQKGVLLDLHEVVNPGLQRGEYLDNVAETYRVEGGLYAVPARFTVPMLLAPEGAQTVHGLQSLADWMEAQESPNMKFTFPAALLEQFYSTEYHSLFQADGSLDEEGYLEFIAGIQRLARFEGALNSWEGEVPVELNGEENAVAWAGELITVHISELDSLYPAAFARQATEERDGIYRPLGNVTIPRTILGVNAAGAQTELAVDFVKTALSSRVLANDFRDGLPVNREALENCTKNPNPNVPFFDYWLFWDAVEEEAELNVYWPVDDFFPDLLDQISSLSSLDQGSEAVRELVFEQSLLCLGGEKSPQEAAADITQKLDLALAEQG